MAHSLVVAGAGLGRLAITKKLVLWSVLILQQGSYNLDYTEAAKVNFVRVRKSKTTLRQSQGHCSRLENVNRYEKDFFQMKIDVLNQTAELAMANYIDLELAPEVWCFREGTLNESRTRDDMYNDLQLQSQPACRCASGWHSRDCGQPEIIWRALMTHSRVSKTSLPMQLREKGSQGYSGGQLRLYYLLELGPWQHLSLELFDLQLRTLIGIVDYFLVYYVSENRERLSYLALQRRLRSILGSNANYLLYQCLINCSSAAAYAYFYRQLWAQCSVQMQANDLLLYGDAQTVYAPAALKFLKYYAVDVLPLRFRLKYNVFGYYWQHPQRTILRGVLSSLVHLHGDPQRLHNQTSYTLGDLNHYGGWTCQLCFPPEQIVHFLQTSKIRDVRLPVGTRGATHIDSNYMQGLISQGIYVDGSTKLLRMRQEAEKYYAPEVALSSGSQYAQLLVNMFEIDVLKDVQEEDD
ncbi:beta-1,4-mannosyl-glycoprotein 4-beta-N-acetylglucosaminyltransferase isoform X2 [Scaptodrosophila lebanonensis]|uniref:Beta-1,4-mannosyl-glycoprotein 4-beta-N-acetylglucosaminyltransferase isoform X2 n=1 Tax=Drosophila lebanonensis TaxID=7225 RepID=A0A6J2U4C6_DROLE|nr:beta-1,4-mannosyl-glycoprotein 4-beta-N-acetylglucosaminyltransferase isoform X2 [Scaptodrosophila lebanonensis]